VREGWAGGPPAVGCTYRYGEQPPTRPDRRPDRQTVAHSHLAVTLDGCIATLIPPDPEAPDTAGILAPLSVLAPVVCPPSLAAPAGTNPAAGQAHCTQQEGIRPPGRAVADSSVLGAFKLAPIDVQDSVARAVVATLTTDEEGEAADERAGAARE
jgi:hypothetical protein